MAPGAVSQVAEAAAVAGAVVAVSEDLEVEALAAVEPVAVGKGFEDCYDLL